MTWKKRDTIIALCLACFAGFLFIPLLDAAHIVDGTESLSAEIAREMLWTGKYLPAHVDFQPSWEHPPLFHWLQTLSMRFFGVNETGARLPSALLGIVTIPYLYLLGKRLHSEQLGILWAICYTVSGMTILYHKSAVAYPLGNVFLISTIQFLSSFYAPRQGKIFALRRIVAAGFCFGGAILSTGVLMMPVVLCVWLCFWFIQRKTLEFPLTEIAVFLAIALLVSLLWFGGELIKSGIPFFREFIAIQLRVFATTWNDHSVPPYVPFVIVFFGCFPVSPLILSAFQKQESETPKLKTFKHWMVLLIAVMMVVCTIAPHKVHETSLVAFPISFLAAYWLLTVFSKRQDIPIFITLCIGFFGTAWTFILLILPLIGLRPTWLPLQLQSLSASAFLQRFTDSLLATSVWSEQTRWSYWEIGIGTSLGCIVLLSVLFALRKRTFEAAFTLLLGSGLVFFVASTTIIPKIEYAAQGALIEFYRRISTEDCYIHTLGFQSSLSLFYSKKQYTASAAALNIPPEDFETWLLEADIDKPAYFVCKEHEAKSWRNHIRLNELAARDGFVFFKREGRAKENLASLPHSRFHSKDWYKHHDQLYH